MPHFVTQCHATMFLQLAAPAVILRRMLLIYNILLWFAFPFVVFFYGAKLLRRGKYRKGFAQRFGCLPEEILACRPGRPRIWVHAVSVGEVTAAAPIIVSLRERLPDAAIVLSTTTDTGQEMARRLVTGANAFFYYPLDISFVVRRVIEQVRPDIFVPVETELWPNLIHRCRKQGLKIVMVNGRLSPRSFKNYARTRCFWKGTLAALDKIGVITAADAERFRFLGMPPERVHVLGNAKYDGLAAMTSPSLREEIGVRLNIAPGDHILVAGSTHEGEEKIVFDVYRKLLESYPDCKLIIVPRHIERAQAVLSLARETGFPDAIMVTELMQGRKRLDERIIIVDIIGELFKVYSLATVVFCGGSLAPRGGQNILEAAAWGKVVFYGPCMDDFQEEKALLEAVGAGIAVRDGNELAEGILKLLADPVAMTSRGEAGRRAVAANAGAAARYGQMISEQLGNHASSCGQEK